jgi:hypothetical protein
MNKSKKHPPTNIRRTNMRRYRRESDRKLLFLVIFMLVVVGGFLIAVILGPEALLTALPCLLAGSALILVLWLLMTAVEKWLNRLDQVGRSDPQTPTPPGDANPLNENSPTKPSGSIED